VGTTVDSLKGIVSVFGEEASGVRGFRTVYGLMAVKARGPVGTLMDPLGPERPSRSDLGAEGGRNGLPITAVGGCLAGVPSLDETSVDWLM